MSLSQKMPAIAEKLAPAQAILDLINEHLEIHSFSVWQDGIESEVSFRGQEPSDDSNLSELAEAAFCDADRLLPENYGVTVKDKRFVIVRLTPKEVAEMQAADEAEGCAPEDMEPVPYCFRLEPAAMAHFDAQGNSTPFYGYRTIHFFKNVKADDRQEYMESMRSAIAKAVATAPEHVTPITVAEYRAAGGTFEE